MHKFWHVFFSPEDGGTSSPSPSAPNSQSGGDASLIGGAAGGQAAATAAEAAKGATDGAGGDKGAQQAAWRATVASWADEADRESISNWASRFTDEKAFAKGLIEARKAASARPPIPDDKASPEDRHAFFKQLGKPDKAEEYQLKDEGYDDVAKARLGEFKQFAHGLDLSQKQAEQLKDWYDKNESAAADQHLAAMKTAKDTNVQALKQRWGPDFDTNVTLAESAGRHFFQSEADLQAFQSFLKTPLQDGSVPGNHPIFLQILAQVGRALTEDNMLAKIDNPAGAADIQAQIDSITEEAIKAGKGTWESPYHEKISALLTKQHGAKPLNHQRW